MGTGNGKESSLKADIGSRMREVLRSHGIKHREAARQMDVPEPTINKWLSGIHYPNMEALVKFALDYDVSLDWLLTGQENLFPKDIREEDFYIKYSKLKSLGVSEQVDTFMDYQVAMLKVKTETSIARSRAAKSFGLDTFGKRLKYVRESEKHLSPEEMADKIELTKADYLRIEQDKLLPGTRALTALTGYLMDPDTKDQSIIDWLLGEE